MLLSVVNALTLSPALAAHAAEAGPTGKSALLTPFYNGFNRVFGWTTDGYVSFAAVLVRKMFVQPRVHRRLVYVTVVLVQRIPGGFVPEEDQGYILVNALLPDAASLERTDAVMKKAEAVLEKNEAVEGFNTISGFWLLTGAYSSNMGFFFVQLKPWDERHSARGARQRRRRALNRAFAQQIPEAGRRRVRIRRPSRASAPAPGSRCSCRTAAAARRSTWRSRPQRFMEAARQAAGDRPHHHALPRQRAADLCRHRPQQGAEARACR